jgi:hypothetical protein
MVVSYGHAETYEFLKETAVLETRLSRTLPGSQANSRRCPSFSRHS